MKPTRLTRPDRWRAKAGRRFAYVTFDAGHAHFYTRLFSDERGANRWVDRVRQYGGGVVDRGFVTFKVDCTPLWREFAGKMRPVSRA